jgi:hypothetical protein
MSRALDWAFAVFVLVVACPTISADAATFELKEYSGAPGESGLKAILVEGELMYGDEKKFADIAIQTSTAVVVLSSPGGSASAGVEIGKAIRLKGFATFVMPDFPCASACALAWLGGVPRLMTAKSKIGFHAIFLGDNGKVSPDGNAVVGAYLSQLGLSSNAIRYITATDPASIQWLTLGDAEENGIEVKQFEIDEPVVSSALDQTRTGSDPGNPPRSSGEARVWIQIASRADLSSAIDIAQQVRGSFDQVRVFRSVSGWFAVAAGPYSIGIATDEVARLVNVGVIPKDSFVTAGERFTMVAWGEPASLGQTGAPDATGRTQRALEAAGDFFDAWSRPNTEALSYLGHLYSPQVVYFGRRVAKVAVMDEKASFASRWRDRTYKVRPGSSAASCDPDGACLVTGIVDFVAHNPRVNTTSTGAATFQLVFSGVGASTLIGESSQIISRHIRKGK